MKTLNQTKEHIMNDNVQDVTSLPKTSRFNLPKVTKIALITVTVLGVALVLKSKLDADVDGEASATVKTKSA